MKERTQKSNTFFGGAAILAVSIAIVKIIGALYKIPLGRILGDVGFGHFNNAYAIYNLLLMISTAGLRWPCPRPSPRPTPWTGGTR